MTEPTHHLRADVSAQLDIVLARVLLHVGIDDMETARESLRDALADAWHHGWMTGHDDGATMRSPVTESPYSRQPAMPAPVAGGETRDESGQIS